MFNYFRLPNFVFDYKLSSTELAVATVLYSLKSRNNKKHIVKIKQENICNISKIKSKITVAKAIKKLMSVGIIKWVKRSKKLDGHLGTYTYCLADVTGKYTKIQRNIFKSGLSVSELKVFLLINKCIDTKTGKCWNSYNDLASKLYMSRSRVIEIVKALIGKGFLLVKKVIKKDGSLSDNHYFMPTKNEADSPSPAIDSNPKQQEYSYQLNSKSFLLFCQVVLKSYSLIGGSPIFYISTVYNPLIPTEKKKVIYLTYSYIYTKEIRFSTVSTISTFLTILELKHTQRPP